MRRLSRRTFLGASGAAAVTPAAAAVPRRLLLEERDGVVTAREEGGVTWVIDPSAAAPGARARKVADDQVELRGGALPGGLPFAVDLAFRPLGADWGVAARWQGLDAGYVRASPAAPLAAVAAGRPLLLGLSGRRLAHVLGVSAAGVIAAPATAALELGADLSVRLRCAKGWFSVLNGAVRFRALRLTPRPTGEDAWRCGAEDRVTACRVPLGRTARASAELLVAEGARVGVFQGPRPLRIDGDLALAASGPRPGPVPCTRASFGTDGAERSCELVLARHWRLATRLGTLDLESAGQPATVAETGGRIVRFEVPAVARSYNLRVPGADWGRLNIPGEPFRLRLAGLPGPAGLPGLALGEAGGTLRLGLCSASLWVGRTRDLLSLTFRFAGVALEVRGGKPFLVAGELPPALAEEGVPLLLAEFPPQHVLEQSFLRQNFELPDADPPVTAAQVRLLARGDTEADKLSKDLHERKLAAAEKADPTGSTFKRFADAWAKERPTQPWVGPLGLFDIASRQVARRLARQVHDAAHDALVSDLAGNGPVSGDLLARVQAQLPLPSLGMEMSAARRIADKAPGAKLDAVMKAAMGEDRDFAALQRAWAAAHPQGKPYFLLTDWPFSAEDKAAVFGGADIAGNIPDPADARVFLKRLLENQAKERAERPLTAAVEGFLAEPSRLAFELDAAELAQGIPLSLSTLTDWRAKNLRVVERARRRFKPPSATAGPTTKPELDNTLEALLEPLGIGKGGTARGRMTAIRLSLTGPDAFHTALHLPARLVLSPAQDARFATPASLPDRLAIWSPRPTDPVPVWQATLVEAISSLPSLRAVWSEDFAPDAFDGAAREPPAPGAYPPMPGSARTPLDTADRHEIVVLSSVYGLPVKGIDTLGSSAPRESSQIAPGEYAISDIETVDGKDASAVFIPTPLTTRRLSLGTLGATLDLDTHFDPPSPARTQAGRDLFAGYSLERLRLLVSDGRDVDTTVVRRGYLFPLGHKASLVKVTEARFRAVDAANLKLGYVVELATRVYVEVTRAAQVYPAVSQPDQGRRFPARRVELLTLRTPDLLDPSEEGAAAPGTDDESRLVTRPRGSVQGTVIRDGKPTNLAGRVFWPRTDIGPAGTVRFRMVIDGGGEPVSLPLLFVDHVAASDPATVAAICTRYYTAPMGAGDPDAPLKPRDWNVMRHGGALRGYADELKQGDCNFATDWQVIEGVGRGGLRPYDFDPPLQGAGQPPFYPVMTEAAIRPQQVQALTGTGVAPVRVRFNDRYVRDGFGGADEPERQTFLDTLDGPRLDMQANGDRAGGVGRPSMPIAGFNRLKGPVGSVPAMESAAPRPVQPLTQATPKPAKSFVDGFFDDDAKLLGIIPLKTFVAGLVGLAADKATPVLQEITEFGGDLQKAAAALEDAVAQVQEQLKGVGGARLYPELDSALTGLDAALRPPADLTKAWSAGQRLLRVLEELSHAPLGPVVDEVRRLLTGAGETLLAAFRNGAAYALADAIASRLAAAAASGAWIETLFQVPLLDDGDAEVVLKAVRSAAGSQATWSDPSPIAAVARAVASDGGVQALEAAVRAKLTEEALQGPLYPEVMDVVARLRQLPAVSPLDLIRFHLRPIAELASRFVAAAAGADAVCADAAATLRDFAAAELPEFGACAVLSTGPGAAACSALAEAAQQLETLANKMEEAVYGTPDEGAAAPLTRFLRGWASALTQRLPALDAVLAGYAAARSLTVQRLAAVQSCAAMDASPYRALAAAEQALRSVVAALADAGLPEALPDDSVPQALAAAWTDAGRIARRLAAATLDGTLAATFAGNATQLANLATGLAARAHLADERVDAVAEGLKQVSDDVQSVRQMLATFAAAPAEPLDQAVAAVTALQAQTAALVDATMGGAQAEVRRLVVRAATAAALPQALREFSKVLDTALGLLSTAYKAALKARDAALGFSGAFDRTAALLAGPPPKADPSHCGGDSWLNSLFLVPQGSVCTVTADRLATEASLAKAGDAAALIKQWDDNQPVALEVIAAHLQELGQLSVRSTVLRLLDVEALRGRLLDGLAALTPLRKVVTNDVALPLKPLSVGGILDFRPLPAERDQALTLSSRVELGLRPDEGGVQAKATFVGDMTPFELEIIGILTFRFQKGAQYAGGTGQHGAFTAPLGSGDVTFGDKLSFLSDLAGYLSLGGDTGPYARVRLDRPAIEAGYRIVIPVITIGVTFTNINFHGAMVLPFDRQPAVISVQLGTLDAPFMISAGIYGGAGYLGLDASEKGIEAADASFQFGGVASLGYGPLQGTAYVTTGAYVRKDKGGCTFGAIFSAGFTAHIACFSVIAFFTIRLLKREGDSGVAGEAVLEFTFKVGFVPVSYQVRAQRGMQAGFGGGGQQAASLGLDRRVQLADSSGGFLPACGPALQAAELVTVAPSAVRDWPGYAAQFDHAFRPDAEVA